MSITLILIILIAAASILAWQKPEYMNKWIMNPYMVLQKKEYYRLLTSGFIHANYFHLAINLFVLYSFGNLLEALLARRMGGSGNILYLALFILALVISDLPSLFKNKNNHYYNSLGASGAVSAVIFACILMEPMLPVGLILFPFFDIPGFVMGGFYLWFESYQAKKSSDNINHDAHMYGALFGFVFLAILSPGLVPEFFQKIIAGVQMWF